MSFAKIVNTEEKINRLDQMQTDWDNSRAMALEDAERFFTVVMCIRNIYEMKSPAIEQLRILRDNLDIFEHSLDESFPCIFYNEFVGKWLYHFSGKDDE